MGWRLKGLVAAGACTIALGGAASASYLAEGSVYRLITPPRDLAISGRATPLNGPLSAWLAAQDLTSTLPDLILTTGDDHIPLPAAELGFSVDTAATETLIRDALPTPTWPRRLKRAFLPTPSWTEVRAVVAFNEEIARKRLQSLADSLYRAPINAELDVARHQRIAAVAGRGLDVDASLTPLRNGIPAEGLLELMFQPIQPKIQDHDLPAVDVTQVLARFETDFRKKAGRRAVNIRRAAKLLDGHIVGPGELFSFNKVVGDRTARNGFVTAPVIVNDELEPGLGGGVCQAATTVYAAAVHGGLETVRRRSHSRPSGYAPLGLDAAVIYGKVDLRLRNPYSTPLMIRAYLPSKYVIRVEWLGTRGPEAVKHRAVVSEKHNFYRRVVETPDLAPGEFKRTQKGGYGYDIVSIVSTKLRDGSQKKRRYSSKYYPVPEVYHVGPDTPLDELPELPEGAARVEVAGLFTELDLAPEGL